MTNKPPICVVGPLAGHHPGNITTQGEKLAKGFKFLGFPVIAVSSSTNRYVRLLDILQTLIRCRSKIHILCIQAYFEASFVIEDLASLLGKPFGHRVIMVLRGGTLPDFFECHPVWCKRVFDRAHVLMASYGFN